MYKKITKENIGQYFADFSKEIKKELGVSASFSYSKFTQSLNKNGLFIKLKYAIISLWAIWRPKISIK